jgi:hypothetical protein
MAQAWFSDPVCHVCKTRTAWAESSCVVPSSLRAFDACAFRLVSEYALVWRMTFVYRLGVLGIS